MEELPPILEHQRLVVSLGGLKAVGRFWALRERGVYPKMSFCG